MSSTLLDLPEDVIQDILLKLPVTALVRSTLVLRKWAAKIKSLFFMSDHYDQPSNPTYPLVCCTDYSNNRTVTSVSLHRDGEVKECIGTVTNFTDICGPSNGFICLRLAGHNSAADHVTLLNPATRKRRHLDSILELDPLDLFSFCMEPLTNEFKLFVVRKREEGYIFQRYSAAEDSWIFFKNEQCLLYDGDYVPPRQVYNYSLVKDSYYFLNACRDGYYSVVEFDIVNEIFTEMKLPELTDTSVVTLSLYNDCLAAFSCDSEACVNGRAYEIWVMKCKNCWTRYFAFEFGLHEQPRGFYSNHELFLHSVYNNQRYDLLLYDVFRKRARFLDLKFLDVITSNYPMQPTPLCFYPLSFKESLFEIRSERCNKEIVVNVPLTAVPRLRSVSKEWRGLIDRILEHDRVSS